ncbi:MAG: hypothetical protein A2W93_02950 [Bacteroidetes bacterium GWF2_43_63]|nr:MAG: hypothetical protein A2W94_08950 [Bacteroidetes bacterium GWE2_42_42]OFY53623.1 MAG: hypothetical protein A2W93_02950 [Bacteroidetes bacterium GWF2_43_63]HBG71040.1 acyltransferase [Bacteroidales bacterium]HCB63618.1 acyltransferase [Bacteroidales bacterium]HCY24367.1 acyltransferase [Bacteroidales bacterium]
MEKFNDIRPYRNEEFHQAFDLLIKEDEFLSVLKYFFHENYALYLENLKRVKTIDEFQVLLIKPILQGIIDSSITRLSFTGTENLIAGNPCLFISNHRDIVMDPSLIDMGLHFNDVPTVEIAIGDNLLVKPWIEMFVKLNKSFVVRRSLSGRDLLKSSMLLSEYIRNSILVRNCFLWIAQREGRAKDGNDRTQESLLRMLGLSGENKDLRNSLLPLNISPVSISYEFDPCDGLKAMELWMKASGKTYVKTPQDDLKNMITGISGKKGNVNIHFSPSINDRLNECTETDSRKQCGTIASIIDEGIFSHYMLYDSHKVAYNMLTETRTFEIADHKTAEIKDYFVQQLKSVGLSENELSFIVTQYANPAVNYLETIRK